MYSICHLFEEDEGGERSQLRHPLEEGYRLKVSTLQSLSFLKDDDEGNFVPPRSSSPHKRIFTPYLLSRDAESAGGLAYPGTLIARRFRGELILRDSLAL